MASEITRMFISVQADIGDARKGIDEINDRLDKMGKKAETTAAQSRGLGETIQRFLGGAIVGQAIGMIGQMSQKYAENEAASKRLIQSIENTGKSYASQQAQVEAAIKRGKDLAFSDNDLANSLSVLVTSTGSSEEAIKRQKIAMDFSVGAHIDLYTASRLLGRITDENVMILKRYGITVDKGSSAVELLNKVEAAYSGQALTRANSTIGTQLKIQNAVEDAQAAVGEHLGNLGSLATIYNSLGLRGIFAAGGIAALGKQISGIKNLPGFVADIGKAAIGLPGMGTGAAGAAGGVGKLAGALGMVARVGGVVGAGIALAVGISKAGQALKAAGFAEGVPVVGGLINKLDEAGQSFDMLWKIIEQKGPLDALGLLKDEIVGSLDPLRKYKDEVAKAAAALDAAKNRAVEFRRTASTVFEGAVSGFNISTIEGILKPFDLADEKIRAIKLALLGLKDVDPNSMRGLTQIRDQTYKAVEAEIRKLAGAQRGPENTLEAIEAKRDQIKAEGGIRFSPTLKADAKAHGRTAAQEWAALNDQIKITEQEAADALKVFVDAANEKIKDAGSAAEDFKSAQIQRLQDEKMKVQELKDAYTDLNIARAAGAVGSGPAPGQSVDDFNNGGNPAGLVQPGFAGGGYAAETGPRMIHKGEFVVDAEKVRRGAGGGGGGLNVSLALNYNGPSTPSAAAEMASDVLDIVTEGLRMQNRRVGNRISPFGVGI